MIGGGGHTGARVVVDARMATDGGIGTYLQALLPRVARLRPGWSFTVLGNVGDMRRLGWQDIGNVTLRHCTAPIFSVREQVEVPLKSGRRANLFWAPHYNVPAVLSLPLAVTVHDVNHLALPELLGGMVRRTYARWLFTSAVSRARRILFVSDFTRRETSRVIGVDGNGVVIHSAVDDDWARARADAPDRPIPEPYLLYVGNIKRHKNVPFLLRAFRRIQNQVPHRLILIGRTEGLRADPDVKVELRSSNGRVELLGETRKDVLRRYVAHADALVTASLYEGFGFPPLEAMAAGCPCLVSRAGSLPEICGDAALYADPRDEGAFAARLLELARDVELRRRLTEDGRRRAGEFSWERSAHRTVVALEEALA